MSLTLNCIAGHGSRVRVEGGHRDQSRTSLGRHTGTADICGFRRSKCVDSLKWESCSESLPVDELFAVAAVLLWLLQGAARSCHLSDCGCVAVCAGEAAGREL